MSLNISNIKIENVKKGTDNQVAKGIHGKFTMDLFLDNGTQFLTLKSMTLRKTRNGTWYIQPPYETWVDRDKNNKKSYFYFLYPNSDDRDAKLADLVTKVVDMVENADANEGSSTAAPAVATEAGSPDGGLADDLF